MRILVNATAIRSAGGVRLLERLLESFFQVAGADLSVLLYLNPELAERIAPLADTHPGLEPSLEILAFSPPNLLYRFFWEQITLPGILRKRKVDLLFSFGNTGPVFPGCEQVLYLQQSLPYTDFRPDTHRMRWCAIVTAFKRLIGLAQFGSRRIMVPTSWLVPPLRRSVGNLIPAERYVVSPPGLPGSVDASKSLDAREAEWIRRVRAWREEGYHILFYPCFLAPYKNLPVLLEAMALLREMTDRPFKLLLTFDAESREYFPCKAEILGTLGRPQLARQPVELLGTLSPQAVAKIYGLTDTLVFASRVETLGLPLLEALEHGVPIVAADTPFAREICGEAALYADAESPAAFAKTLKCLLEEDGLRLVLLAEGQARRRAFCWKAHARKILGLSEFTDEKPSVRETSGGKSP